MKVRRERLNTETKIGTKTSCKDEVVSDDICCSQGDNLKSSCNCGSAVAPITKVGTNLNFADKLGAVKARLGINRDKYRVTPGLYSVGDPDKTSEVLVTANYKLTFDSLRKELSDMNVWILVLDTKGVNVWCAAGKGTFGTEELINRISKVDLKSIVDHRNLILPQLGAPGVSAHFVKNTTGFNIKFGPIRACDLKEYLKAGKLATREMRKVKFGLKDRLVLIPLELITALKHSIFAFGILFIINLVAINPFAYIDFYAYMGAIFAGCVAVPILLPYIPGRAFAWKGWLIGFLWAIKVNIFNGLPQIDFLNNLGFNFTKSYSLLHALAFYLVLPAISAYYAMNFTGSSTYTSLSGVEKEMKKAVPFIAATLVIGLLMLLADCFIA